MFLNEKNYDLLFRILLNWQLKWKMANGLVILLNGFYDNYTRFFLFYLNNINNRIKLNEKI